MEPDSNTLKVSDSCKAKYLRKIYDGRVAAISKCEVRLESFIWYTTELHTAM